MKPSCHHDATIMQPSCNHTNTCAMLRRHLRRLRRRRAGARMPVPSPAPAPKRGENVGLDLDRRAGKYQNRSVIRGMRILLTTFDPIFLLPPTHPSGSCGSTVHARAWSWAGLRLVRAARGFDGVGVGVKSPQRHSSLASQAGAQTWDEVTTALQKLVIYHAVRRTSPVVSRDARTTMSARSIAHAARCNAAACFARRKAKTAKTNTTLHPFEGPNSLFPLRGTVIRSPLPSRSFPFEGFPSFSPFEGP